MGEPRLTDAEGDELLELMNKLGPEAVPTMEQVMAEHYGEARRRGLPDLDHDPDAYGAMWRDLLTRLRRLDSKAD